jgi:hypothetical protein
MFCILSCSVLMYSHIIVYFYIRTSENLVNVGSSRNKLPRHLQCDTDPSGQNWSDTACRRRHVATCRRHFQLRSMCHPFEIILAILANLLASLRPMYNRIHSWQYGNRFFLPAGRSVTANIGWYVISILHDRPPCNIDITRGCIDKKIKKKNVQN